MLDAEDREGTGYKAEEFEVKIGSRVLLAAGSFPHIALVFTSALHFVLKLETEYYAETLRNFYQTARYHTAEDCNLHSAQIFYLFIYLSISFCKSLRG